MSHSRCNEHITCGWNGLCNDIPLLEYLLVKKSTNGVFSGGGGAAWNSCFLSLMKTMWACKSWKMKNPRWMDHAIKGGKLISFQLICQYFQIRKHSWTHPLILKNFCFTFIDYFGIFWCLILPSHIPFFIFYFFLFYLHPWPCSIWTKKSSCILLSKHMYFINTMARRFSIFRMHLFK